MKPLGMEPTVSPWDRVVVGRAGEKAGRGFSFCLLALWIPQCLRKEETVKKHLFLLILHFLSAFAIQKWFKNFLQRRGERIVSNIIRSFLAGC